MSTAIFVILAAVMLFFVLKAWQVWKERFGGRDDNYEIMQMQRLLDSDEKPDEPIQAVAVMAGGKLPASVRKPAAAAPARSLPPLPDAAQIESRKHLPVLDAPAQEIYLRLHAEMPQIPLLACVDVAALTGTTGVTPPRVQADFVLCKKDFTPAVVIFIDRVPGDSLQARAEQLLRLHRLRVLRWPVDRLPSREEMRKQIFRPKAA